MDTVFLIGVFVLGFLLGFLVYNRYLAFSESKERNNWFKSRSKSNDPPESNELWH